MFVELEAFRDEYEDLCIVKLHARILIFCIIQGKRSL